MNPTRMNSTRRPLRPTWIFLIHSKKTQHWSTNFSANFPLDSKKRHPLKGVDQWVIRTRQHSGNKDFPRDYARCIHVQCTLIEILPQINFAHNFPCCITNRCRLNWAKQIFGFSAATSDSSVLHDVVIASLSILSGEIIGVVAAFDNYKTKQPIRLPGQKLH